ncbi:hypothetical protein THF5H11_80064 [Vibrio jasicida]|nr:hypothetical protein THF5H11_80064 [Vibrio jasicida]
MPAVAVPTNFSLFALLISSAFTLVTERIISASTSTKSSAVSVRPGFRITSPSWLNSSSAYGIFSSTIIFIAPAFNIHLYEFVYSQDAKLKRLCPFLEKSQQLYLSDFQKQVSEKKKPG